MALVVGLLVACSGGGGSTGSSSGSASSLDAFLAQYCDSFAPCCASSGKPYDQARCKSLFTALLGAGTYDPVAGQQCIDAVHAASSQPDFCATGPSDDANTKCNGTILTASSSSGKQPGEPCNNDSDCASTADGKARCASSYMNGATTKQCQIQVRGKENDQPCVGVKDGSTTVTSVSSSSTPPPRVIICWTADGLFCDSKSTKCLRIQDVGGSCDGLSTYACVKTAYCDFTTKKCVARKALNDACTTSTECADKTYCSTTTKKCTASTPSGGACTRSEECEGKSCVNGKCTSSGSLATAFVCSQ